MKFSTVERILLSQMLPNQGSFQNLKLLRVLKEELSFNDEENKSLKFRKQGGQLLFNDFVTVSKRTGQPITGDPNFIASKLEADPDAFERKPVVPEKEIEVGETIKKLIIKALADLDKAEKLTEQHLSLCDKFLPEQEKGDSP